MCKLRLVLGSALLGAAAAALAPSRAAASCTDELVPFEVEIDGLVRAVHGRRVVLDEFTAHLPAGPGDLTWCEDDGIPAGSWGEDVEIEPFRVGDVITVAGSLRADGTVLAHWTYLSEPYVPERPGVVGAGYDAGVVTSVDDAVRDPSSPLWQEGQGVGWFHVDGVPYRIDPNAADFEIVNEAWAVGVPEILSGDAVALSWTEDADGVRTVGEVTVRRAGDGGRLEGTIDAVLDELNSGVVVVDGISCPLAMDAEVVCAAGLSHEDDWSQLRPGVTGVFRGTLRAGRLLVDRIYLYSDNPHLAGRAGKVQLNGIVDAVRPGGLTVCGLDAVMRGAETPAKAARRGVRTPRVRPGTRVRVEGRTYGDGRVVVDRLRAR